MPLLFSVVDGLSAGWMAGKTMIGISGAVAAAFFARSVRLLLHGPMIYTILAAIFCVAILAALSRRRKAKNRADGLSLENGAMRRIRNSAICLAAGLLFVPLACGRDLSKYRNFSLGTSLAELSRQVNGKPADVTVIHPSPALIQELAWWPAPSYQSAAASAPVQDILFSFYNGELYRIAVTYKSSATEGLTAEDIVRAVSAQYGAATVPVSESNPPAIAAYDARGETIASWEDSQYLLTLSSSTLSSEFQLVLFSKQLNSRAEAAIAEAVKQKGEDAPQREIARAKKEADDQETTRQGNLKTFRP